MKYVGKLGTGKSAVVKAAPRVVEIQTRTITYSRTTKYEYHVNERVQSRCRANICTLISCLGSKDPNCRSALIPHDSHKVSLTGATNIE